MTGLACWWDDAADGPVNMATDEALALEAERSRRVLVRCYGWTRTTVSLGGFQPVVEARAVPGLAVLPLVRRPSGGGAIIHGSDLTYAIAVPKEHPWGRSAQSLYDAVHGAAVEELRAHGVAARLYAATDEPGDRIAPDPYLCFDRRSPGDVVVARVEGPPGTASEVSHGAAKVLGSAQRRLAGVILQHGSLLWRSNTAVAASCTHPGLADLVPTGSLGDFDDLARSWLDRVAHVLGGSLTERRQFAAGREAEVARLSARFTDDRWTTRR